MSRILLLALSCALLAAGCAGSRGAVVADGARYPISFSPALLDERGRVLYRGEGLVVRGPFEVESTELGFFYSAVGGDLDISEEVNEQVKRHGGEGITDLEVRTEQCASNWLFPLNLLPIWPGCQSYTVQGLVVSRGGAR